MGLALLLPPSGPCNPPPPGLEQGTLGLLRNGFTPPHLHPNPTVPGMLGDTAPLDNHEAGIPHLFRGCPPRFGEEERMRDAGGGGGGKDAHPWSPAAGWRIPPPAAPGGGLSDARVRGGRCGDACVHRLYIPPWHRRRRSHRSEEPAADSTPAGRKSALIFHPRGAWLGFFFESEDGPSSFDSQIDIPLPAKG